MKPLFSKENITLHSGLQSDFKIECDALTDADIECLAYIISKEMNFRAVYGVANGGIRLESALKKYSDNNSANILICDDVLTTGGSMERIKGLVGMSHPSIIGVVIFARGKCPDWVKPVFTFNFLN